MSRLPNLRQKSYSRVPLFDGDANSDSDDGPVAMAAEHSSSSRRPVALKRLSSGAPQSSPRNMAGYGSREPKASTDLSELDPESPIFPSEMDGKTLFEKKCILVNREMDDMGMGRYQWSIWWLCGCGYLLDLMWAQAFGLVLQPLRQELGFGGGESGNITASFNAGLTAGAAFWGILVDIIGRRWAFNLTCLFSSVFGLGLGATNSYTAFLILTACVGFGVGGNIPIDTLCTLEFIPQRQRRLLPFLSVFQPIGVVVTTALAYLFIPNYSCQPDFLSPDALKSCSLVEAGQPCCGRDNNMGWRYTLYTIGAVSMSVFILRIAVFNFLESPKFLVYKGRDAEAVRVLESISAYNKRKCRLSLHDFEGLEEETDSMGSGAAMLGGSGALSANAADKAKLEINRYKLLFNSPSMAFLTILVWLTYICDYWGFTVAGAYIPSILAAKNSQLPETSVRATYRQYIWVYLPGILGVLLGVFCYDLPRLGRKWTMVLSSGLMAVSLWIWTTVNSTSTNIGLSLMEYFFQSMFNAVLYGWTPEAFPAPVRGTACGLSSFFGRVFGIAGPLIAQSQLSANPTLDDYNRVLYVAGGVTLGCVLFTALLPNHLVGSQSM